MSEIVATLFEYSNYVPKTVIAVNRTRAMGFDTQDRIDA